MPQNKRHKISGPAIVHVLGHGFRSQPGHLSCAVESENMSEPMKACSKCGREQKLSDFYRNRTRPDGRKKQCKQCEQAWRHAKYWCGRTRQSRLTDEQKRVRACEQARIYYYSHREQIVKRKRAYMHAHPHRARAKYRLWHAIRHGKFARGTTCAICRATTRIEAHHQDYTKPLDVTWVCSQCHGRIHSAINDVRNLMGTYRKGTE